MSLLLWVFGIIFLSAMITTSINHSHLNTNMQEIHKILIEINDRLAKNEPGEEEVKNDDSLYYDEICPGCGANSTNDCSECPDCGLKLVD